MENTFKKGLILGGLLAAGTAVGVAVSRRGQEDAEDLQGDVQLLTKTLQSRMHRLEDVTKYSFDGLVDAVIDEFASRRHLAAEIKDKLAHCLQATWCEFEREYQNDPAFEKSS